jgi:hypothetical protein
VVDNTKEKDEFEFEVEQESAPAAQAKAPAEKPEIEVEDDTPPEDRGRAPMPKALVDELEADELEEYSEKVKTRLKQMKKVWHDERREKEAARREQQEAVDFARKIMEENKRLKSTLSKGEETLIGSYRDRSELQLEQAKKAYKEAYEAGDADKLVDAQTKLSEANYAVQRLKEYKPTLQDTETEVELPQQISQASQPPAVDTKTRAWQERNTWFGTDEEMTATALGLHQKLGKQYGDKFVGTDEYWRMVDDTMHRRFPEYFGEEKPADGGGKPTARSETKAATVVAPASRSTSSKKIVLKQSQVMIAKRLGLTPEQYAREMKKLEN